MTDEKKKFELDDVLPKLLPLFELAKDGFTFVKDPVDDTTGEIDVSEIGEDLVDVLQAFGAPIPENFKVLSIKFTLK